MDRTDRGGGRSVRPSKPTGLESWLAWATLLTAPACLEDQAGAREGREQQALGTTIEPRAATPREPSLGCNGEPLPPCDGPFTGAACDLPCMGDGDAHACGIDRTCHSDGRTYAVATRNAVLYAASPEDADDVVEAAFETWIVEHPGDLGVAAGLSAVDIELHRIGDFRSAAGPLTIFRFTQTHHDLPVLAPDGIITLVYGPQGAVAVTGAVIDGRTRYDHRDVQATAAKATHSLLAHASAHSGVPTAELEVGHATPVAIPMRQAVGWAGFVRRKTGASVARVIVDADPALGGPVLPLWSYQEAAVAGLADTQPIQVHALETTGDPSALAFTDQTMLTTGAPLLGSVEDASQEIQLATGRVVLLDLHGALEDALETAATRVLHPTGDFLAEAGPELSAQTAYHLFQSWYDFIDQRLTDPVTGAKRWDSANLVYSNGMSAGDTPPGTYQPRVLAFTNVNPADCPASANACAEQSGYRADREPALTFPELAHIPPGASKQETTGKMKLRNYLEPVTFAHELGHIIDLFAGGGITDDIAPGCAGSCTYECVEGTTDEAPPLTETLAQLLTFVFLRQSFDGVDWQHCSIVDMVSINGSKPWTPGPCVPAGEDISVFQRPDACSKPSDYCDRPKDPGVGHRCCFDDEDLSDCTLVFPAQCPVGDTGPSGGMGTGTARPVPTGMCEHRQGYATNSVFQAFWQWLNGQRCEPTAPFACISVSWGLGVDPMAATTDALLYAMRVNVLTYDELFEEMARYVSCTYGEAAYAEFNAVACNHGLRDCALAAPMKCESCGNGVREGSETCDGSDWLYPRCDAMPEYSGGTLTCDPDTCTLDESQCTMPGLDTTAGTMTPEESTTTTGVDSGPAMETETDPGAIDAGSAGCECRAGASHGAELALFPLSLLGARRRRRSV